MRHFLVDIETCPRLDDELIAKLAEEAGKKVPKNYKDPEKIEAKAREIFVGLQADAALSPRTGGIFAITCAETKRGGNIYHWSTNPLSETFEEDERNLLGHLLKTWDAQGCELSLAGFNAREFDVPFTVARMVRHKVFPSTPFPLRGRDWKMVTDLRDIFSFGPLNHVLQACGIADKGREGNKIWEASIKDVEKYCIAEMRGMLELYNAAASILDPNHWR